MTSGMHKTGTMVAARVTDNSGDRGPRIGVGGDEQAELGSLMVGVKFLVEFFPNEFYE